jgi:gliding motility-associated-like protein
MRFLSLISCIVILCTTVARSQVKYDGCPFAVNFDGTNARAKVSWPNYSTHNSITIALWARYEQKHDGQEKVIVQKSARGPQGNAEYTLALDISGNIKFQVMTTKGLDSLKTTGFTMKQDTFYHFAATLDENTSAATIYLNGEPVASKTMLGPLFSPFFFSQNIPIIVGCSAFSFSNTSGVSTYGYTSFFKGTLDELAIGRKALTKSQIDTVANGLMVEEIWKRFDVLSYFKVDEGYGTKSENVTKTYTGTGTGRYMDFEGANWKACEVSTKYIDIANLRVYADSIPANINPRVVKGNVHILPRSTCAAAAKLLYFEGNVVVDTVENSISSNNIYFSNVGSYNKYAFRDGFSTSTKFSVVNDELSLNSYILSNVTRLGGLSLGFKSFKVKCDAVQVIGEVGLPNYLYPKENPFVPFKVQVDSIFISKKGVDLVGGVKLLKKLQYKKIGLEDLEVKYDFLQDIFSGKITILSPIAKFPMSIKVVKAEIEELTIGYVATSLQTIIRLGNTGWAIDSIGAGVANLRSNYKYWALSGGARAIPIFTINPATFTIADVTFDGDYQFGTAWGVKASLSLLGHKTYGARLRITPSHKELSVNANLFECIKGNAAISLSGTPSKVQGFFNLNIQVPAITSPWYLRWINHIYPQTDIFSCSNYLTSSYLAGTVKPWVPLVPRLYYYTQWNNGWNLKFDKTSSIIPLEAQAEFQLRSAGLQRTAAALQAYSFTVNTPTEAVIVSAKGKKIPSVTLFLSTGDSLNATNYNKHQNVLYLADTLNTTATYIITNPPPGTYYVRNGDADSIRVSNLNQAPKIAITNVIDDKSASKLSVSFTASDPDDNALILFGLDFDKNNANGIILQDSLQKDVAGNTVALNYSKVRSGKYYLYGSITDSMGQHSHFYYDNPVTIINKAAPKAPAALTVSRTDTSLNFNFNKNNSGPLNYLIHYTSDTGIITLHSDNFAIGDTNSVDISNMTAGKFYQFAVSAIDSLENESDLSNIVKLTWKSNTINNHPTINPTITATKIKVGTNYQVIINALDPDGDALTYTITSGASNASINSLGQFSWVPGNANLGYNNFCIKVSDNKGGSDSFCFDLFVYNTASGSPLVSFNRSSFETVSDLAMIEVSDPLVDKEKLLQVRVFSTSDQTGINISAARNGEQTTTFTGAVPFSNTPGTSNAVYVKKGDTVFVKYTSNSSGKVATNYSLFKHLKADFLFKDSICSSDGIKLFNASKGSNLTYRWDFGDSTNSTEINPKHVYAKMNGLASKKYLVKLIIIDQQKVSDTLTRAVTVVNNERITIAPVDPIQLCPGQTATLTSSLTQSIQWYRNDSLITGANAATLLVNDSGIYTIKPSYANGCKVLSDTKTVSVTSIQKPTLSASGATTLCSGDSVVLNSSYAATNQWYKNDTLINAASVQSIVAKVGGKYIVKVLKDGCSSLPSNEIAVLVNNTSLPLFITGSPTICSGNTTTLQASIANASYQWFKDNQPVAGATSQTYTTTAAGSYVVKIGDAGCTSTSAAVSISISAVPPTPTITSPATTICEGQRFTLQSSQTGAHEWYKDGQLINGSSAALYTGALPGSYTAKSISNGCSSSSSSPIVTNVNPLPTGSVSSTGTELCPGSSIDLSAVGGNQYKWYKDGAAITNATSAKYAATQAGIYTADIISDKGCSARATNSLILKLMPKPSALFTYSWYCKDQPTAFTNTSVNSTAAGLIYNWSFGDNTTSSQQSPTHTYSKAGPITVTLIASNATCTTLSDTIKKVITIEAANTGVRYPTVVTAIGNTEQLSARNIGQSFQWLPTTDLSNPTSRTPSLNVKGERSYVVLIVTPSGCTVTDSVDVKLNTRTEVFVPKGFTPNSNGVNDVLRPMLLNVPIILSFKVFNRWGKVVFETKTIGAGWNGTLNGAPQPVDTYVWVFEGIDRGGNKIKTSGKSILIR